MYIQHLWRNHARNAQLVTRDSRLGAFFRARAFFAKTPRFKVIQNQVPTAVLPWNFASKKTARPVAQKNAPNSIVTLGGTPNGRLGVGAWLSFSHMRASYWPFWRAPLAGGRPMVFMKVVIITVYPRPPPARLGLPPSALIRPCPPPSGNARSHPLTGFLM